MPHASLEFHLRRLVGILVRNKNINYKVAILINSALLYISYRTSNHSLPVLQIIAHNLRSHAIPVDRLVHLADFFPFFLQPSILTLHEINMVKVKTICRNPEEHTRETASDIYKVYKNTDSNLHPLTKAREYKRALNAAKMEKMFAKPFVAAFSEHTDSVYSIARSNTSLVRFT